MVKVGNDEDAHFVETKSGNRYRSNAVLIATGSTYKWLGVPGEDYIGAGVHYIQHLFGVDIVYLINKMETSLFAEEGHTAPEWVCGSHLDEVRACYSTGAAACGSWSA